MRTLHRPLLLLLLALASGACSSTPAAPDPSWRQAELECPSDRVLWKIVLLQLERNKFPITGGLNPSSGEILSGWRTNLQPFRGKGNRVRAEVIMEPQKEGLWKVRAHVQKQRNMSLSSPLDPTRAEWEWVSDDVVQAEILLRHILSAFAPVLEIEEQQVDPDLERINAASGNR